MTSTPVAAALPLDALATADAERLAPAQPGKAPPQTTLAGASFLQQEPGLAKEAGLSARDISGWAMGGSSISD